MESRFNDLRFNDIPGITINIRLPGKSYICSKMFGENPQFNDLPFNDTLGLTMLVLLPERKIFPGITINQYDRPQEMLNIPVCAPSALSSLPFNSFFSLNIFEGFLCWKV